MRIRPEACRVVLENNREKKPRGLVERVPISCSPEESNVTFSIWRDLTSLRKSE
jgi:hypothetical protein